jgi:large subunit ribosomal protein L21
MYAIIEIAGQQFKVEKNQKIFVNKLEQEEGSQVDVDSVLLLDNDKDVLIGDPLVKGARIIARVISHTKGNKVRVFKKKKRKWYQVLNGHRQHLTEIMIEDILEKYTEKGKTAAKLEKVKTGTAESKPDKPVMTADSQEKTSGDESPAQTAVVKEVTAAGIKEKKPVAKKTTTKKSPAGVTESKVATDSAARTKKPGEQKAPARKTTVKKAEAGKGGTKKKTTE